MTAPYLIVTHLAGEHAGICPIIAHAVLLPVSRSNGQSGHFACAAGGTALVTHVTLAAILGQLYVFTDQDGWTYRFGVADGYTLAKKRAPHSLITFFLKECGIGMPEMLSRYPDLNRQYAESLPIEALSEPILFLPWKSKRLPIDGYHRVAKQVGEDGSDESGKSCIAEQLIRNSGGSSWANPLT